jgi:hypothetical protein
MSTCQGGGPTAPRWRRRMCDRSRLSSDLGRPRSDGQVQDALETPSTRDSPTPSTRDPLAWALHAHGVRGRKGRAPLALDIGRGGTDYAVRRNRRVRIARQPSPDESNLVRLSRLKQLVKPRQRARELGLGQPALPRREKSSRSTTLFRPLRRGSASCNSARVTFPSKRRDRRSCRPATSRPRASRRRLT